MASTTLAPSYDQIAPLLHAVDVKRGALACKFRCPRNGVVVEATAPLQHDQTSLSGRSVQRVRTGLIQATLRPLRRTLARHLGRGPLSRIAADLVTDVAATATEKIAVTSDVRERTIVAAFRSVEDRFEISPDSGELKMKEPSMLQTISMERESVPG